LEHCGANARTGRTGKQVAPASLCLGNPVANRERERRQLIVVFEIRWWMTSETKPDVLRELGHELWDDSGLEKYRPEQTVLALSRLQ